MIALNLDKAEWHIGPTQLLNTTGIEGGIHDCQVLKYRPSVTFILMFQYLLHGTE